MGGSKVPDIKLLAAFMKDFWQLIKTFYTPGHNSEIYWHHLNDAAAALGHKYGLTAGGNTDERIIMSKLINAFCDAQEEREKMNGK